VAANLKDLALLTNLMAMTSCLFANTQGLEPELYLHQLVPSVLTCVVGKRLCASPATEDHWQLRDRAASLVATICARHGGVYANLQPRVTRALFEALADAGKPLTSVYGAIVAITRLGPLCVELLLLPHLAEILARVDGAKRRHAQEAHAHSHAGAKLAKAEAKAEAKAGQKGGKAGKKGGGKAGKGGGAKGSSLGNKSYGEALRGALEARHVESALLKAVALLLQHRRQPKAEKAQLTTSAAGGAAASPPPFQGIPKGKRSAPKERHAPAKRRRRAAEAASNPPPPPGSSSSAPASAAPTAAASSAAAVPGAVPTGVPTELFGEALIPFFARSLGDSRAAFALI